MLAISCHARSSTSCLAGTSLTDRTAFPLLDRLVGPLQRSHDLTEALGTVFEAAV
jgi:hypothetical protein